MGGVCEKLGKSLDMDATLFRFLFIVWFIMNPPVAMLVYLLSWLLI